MMIRSAPPASAHLADIPVPAPATIIGRPDSPTLRRRARQSFLANATFSSCPVADGITAGGEFLLATLHNRHAPRYRVGVSRVAVT
jgi:hypothetical protein